MTLSIHPLHEFARLVSRPTRLAAMDIGRKTIGLAMATPDWQMITPLGTITRGTAAMDVAALTKAFKGFDVAGVIIGLPLNMDGTEGPQAQSIRATVANWLAVTPNLLKGVALCFFDERLSTAAAENTLADFGSRKSLKQSGALDAVAATVILQRAIDHLKTESV